MDLPVSIWNHTCVSYLLSILQVEAEDEISDLSGQYPLLSDWLLNTPFVLLRLCLYSLGICAYQLPYITPVTSGTFILGRIYLLDFCMALLGISFLTDLFSAFAVATDCTCFLISGEYLHNWIYSKCRIIYPY